MATVYILGAGASYFAGFSLGKELRPFLKRELQKNGRRQGIDNWKYALSFIKEAKGAVPRKRILENGEPDLEFILSLVDQIEENQRDERASRLCHDLDETKKRMNLSSWDMGEVGRGFRRLVSEAFQCKSLEFKEKIQCDDDNLIAISDRWANLVKHGDTLITFNWDLVNEILLSRMEKWSPQAGYGIPEVSGEPPAEQTVMILKLHGSCNWALRSRQDSLSIDLKDLFFDQNTANESPLPVGVSSDFGESLVVPSYLKNYTHISILKPLWERASEKLRQAGNIVVLGYSLPDADFLAQRLFQGAISQNTSLTSFKLVLGKGDEESYARWEKLCGHCCKAPEKTGLNFEEFILYY